VHEHSEASREASSQSDTAVTARPESLIHSPASAFSARDVLRLQRAAGNRAVARLVGTGRRIQRRTAEPERSDKTRTFTYSLKLYTVDAESHAQAQEVADTLNAFTATVFDEQTQREYTVRFQIAVYAPPEPDILENAFGVSLHYRAGRKRLRTNKYREAAERWWLQYLRQPGNTGNLYLGDHPPLEETKAFIRETAGGIGANAEENINAETKRRIDEARLQGSTDALEAARDYYRKEMHELRKNPPEEVVQEGLDNPDERSRGTTFSEVVTQMRGPRGPAQYKLNVRVHEIMHLLGLTAHHKDTRPSVMSYSYVAHDKTRSAMPNADDIEQLVYADNPPSTTSVD
jgi:hypothetical protein